MSNVKKDRISVLYLHALIYAVVVFVTIFPILNTRLFIYVYLPVIISHLVIDYVKIKIENQKKESSIYRNTFIIDQILHSAIIIIFASIYANFNTIALNQLGFYILSFYNMLGMSITPSLFLRFIFVLLVIGKPGNIIIRELNNKDKIIDLSKKEKYIIIDDKSNISDETEYKNAGKCIGILERILIVILVILNQYAAVGLIFAAKSLTRYNKIITIPSFAEYYLVGTLLSLLIAIGAVLLIQPI